MRTCQSYKYRQFTERKSHTFQFQQALGEEVPPIVWAIEDVPNF